ncbi:hypothetical protein [Streptomyces sp. NPDC088762]|uniref:hypothetical protein n=1 Tax=Streptomyces sp. NPDC088762 TaxID=3365891 RepID=UPI00380750F6
MKDEKNKGQEQGKGLEEHMPEHPGPDPVHPGASKPVAGKSPEDLRRMQERKMARERDDAG